VYRCQGDDRWIAIAVLTDEEWHALVQAMGRPAWASVEKFATQAGRKTYEVELNNRIEEWTQTQEAEPLEALLQQVGLAAGFVAKQSDLHEDPQLQHWGFFAWREHKVMGLSPYDGLMSRLSQTPGDVTPAPLLGEHYEAILKGILKFSDEEIAEMIGKGIVEMMLE
jgi:crotonobetainyl-CoA:carnitine CoA-transferase CaiB-like acyl-CoA transferase